VRTGGNNKKRGREKRRNALLHAPSFFVRADQGQGADGIAKT
jgi:hypothetical protein